MSPSADASVTVRTAPYFALSLYISHRVLCDSKLSVTRGRNQSVIDMLESVFK